MANWTTNEIYFEGKDAKRAYDFFGDEFDFDKFITEDDGCYVSADTISFYNNHYWIETPYCTPIPAFLKLSQLFPDMKITVNAVDEDAYDYNDDFDGTKGWTAYVVEYSGGEIISEKEVYVKSDEC